MFNKMKKKKFDESMLSVDEALDRILRQIKTLEPKVVSIIDSLGCVLAEDIFAKINVPYANNSAMDGYAVIADNLKLASQSSPIKLKVIDLIKAGDIPSTKLKDHSAIRIMTGGAVPKGADAILPFEYTEDEVFDSKKNDSYVTVIKTVSKGDYIRLSGKDVKKGEKILTQGMVLGPAEIGVLASIGINKINIFRKPIVSILSTGDELIDPGTDYSIHMTYDSNASLIASSVLNCGGVPKILGVAKDTIESVNEKLRLAYGSDLLITTAGVSKGDYDIVKDVLEQKGKIDFWSVNMKPGKPLAFGNLDLGDGIFIPHLGLPGNPVSALVTFEQFGRNIITKMLGKKISHSTISAVLDEPIYNLERKRTFVRVIVENKGGVFRAKLTGDQSSNLLTSVVRANGLAICPEDIEKKDIGDTIEVQMLY